MDSYLISARARFAAVVLENGEVLISGGESVTNYPFSHMSSTEIYSPWNRKWRGVTDMLAVRIYHTLTILKNRKSILAIGSDDTLDSYTAEIYDIETNRWSYVPNIMNVGRHGHTATLLKSGQVLIVGGVRTNHDHQSSVQLYDSSSNTFISTGNLNTARDYHTATLLNDGLRVLVTGGDDHPMLGLLTAEIYSSGSWSYTLGNMMIGRRNHAAVLLPNGNVLIAGGYTHNHTPLLSAEIYDIITSTFSPTKSMACARWEFTLILLPTGKVLAVGGTFEQTDECLLVPELYDPIIGEWTSTRLLNTPHYNHVTVLLNNSVLIIGGRNQNYTHLHECERYDL